MKSVAHNGVCLTVVELGADCHTVTAIKEAGLTTKAIVGGAPVTEAFATQIGAAGFSDDAPGAVELARSLMAA